MAEGLDPRDMEIKLDEADLYREDVFTDRRVGTLRRLVPVDKHGNEDSGRPTLYVGQAQLWTQMGPLPINFEVEATSLEQALEGFPAAAKVAIEQTLEEAREMRRQQASQIVVPDVGPGGKIQMP